MGRRQVWWIGSALLWSVGVVAPAALAPAPLIQSRFEDSADGWTVIGTGAHAAPVHDPASVHAGKGALRFDYTIAKGQFNALSLPTPNGRLARAQSFRFWIKAGHATPVVVLLQERAGGHYSAVFTAPAGRWQAVALAPADFILGEGKDDPRDPDNRLDLDQVESVSLLDLSQLFAQSGSAALNDLLGIQPGPRTLLLDDFTVSSRPLPQNSARPQLPWIVVGNARLSRASGKPLAGPGLELAYRQAPGKVVGLLKLVRRGSLAGVTGVKLSVATAKPTVLMLHLEEQGGGKYNAALSTRGGSALKPVSLTLADFEAADDSQDADGRLDMDQVNQVSVLDVSGLVDPNAQSNTLWLSGPRFLPVK